MKITVTRKKIDEHGIVTKYKVTPEGNIVPEGMKYCKECACILDLSMFTKQGTRCASCANKLSREYYAKAKHKKEWLDKRNLRIKKDGKIKKERAIKHLGNKCVDCNGIFPASVYDFHHLDPSIKEYNIGNIVRRKSFQTVEEELTKCVLLCANCHRIRHFEGGNYEVGAT